MKIWNPIKICVSNAQGKLENHAHFGWILVAFFLFVNDNLESNQNVCFKCTREKKKHAHFNWILDYYSHIEL
jgi:hypothetical protein